MLCLLWNLKPEFWTDSVCTRVVKNVDARFESVVFHYIDGLGLHHDNCLYSKKNDHINTKNY